MKAGGRPGVRRVQRAAEWGKAKYAGSLAEDLWRRLDAMDFINRGMVFAATLLLCLFPFLIVVSALAGRSAAQSLARHTGLNRQAAADLGHLFALRRPPLAPSWGPRRWCSSCWAGLPPSLPAVNITMLSRLCRRAKPWSESAVMKQLSRSVPSPSLIAAKVWTKFTHDSI